MIGLIIQWSLARQERTGGSSAGREKPREEERQGDASEKLKKWEIWYRGEVAKACDRT